VLGLIASAWWCANSVLGRRGVIVEAKGMDNLDAVWGIVKGPVELVGGRWCDMESYAAMVCGAALHLSALSTSSSHSHAVLDDHNTRPESPICVHSHMNFEPVHVHTRLSKNNGGADDTVYNNTTSPWHPFSGPVSGALSATRHRYIEDATGLGFTVTTTPHARQQ